MSFAYNTPVNINATSERAIQNISVGDKIFAASYNNASEWNEQAVNFSSGTPGGQSSMMVYIRFMQQNNQGQIIVTPDQPFLLSTKEIQRADHLIPGVSSLLSATGASIEVLDISIGMYQGGIHDIAFNTGNKGNWIVASGVVCGDYTIELYQSKQS